MQHEPSQHSSCKKRDVSHCCASFGSRHHFIVVDLDFDLDLDLDLDLDFDLARAAALSTLSKKIAVRLCPSPTTTALPDRCRSRGPRAMYIRHLYISLIPWQRAVPVPSSACIRDCVASCRIQRIYAWLSCLFCSCSSNTTMCFYCRLCLSV